MLPRKSQKLEFLAVRINFFWLAASFDVKKLVKSQQKLLAASLKIPQLRSMTIASDRRKYLGMINLGSKIPGKGLSGFVGEVS